MSAEPFPPKVTSESNAAFRAMIDRAVQDFTDPYQKLTADQTLFSLRAHFPKAPDRVYVVDVPYIRAHMAEIHRASYAATLSRDDGYATKVFVCGLVAGGADGVRATDPRHTPEAPRE